MQLSFSSITTRIFKLAALSCLVILGSCTPKEEGIPAGILDKDKMIAVLVDIHLAEASNENRSLSAIQLNEIVARKYDTVMMKHNITYAGFKTSFEYYLQHPGQFDEIYQEVVNRLSAMEGKSRAKKPHMESSRVDSL